MEKKPLEFCPFSSCVNHSFWTKYTSIKLEIDKLSEEGRNVWGIYSNVNFFNKATLELDSTSFNTDYNGPNMYIPIQGNLYNMNTLEKYKDCDKQAFIEKQGAKLWSKIEDGSAIKNPLEANSFFILSFIDLKKYNYYYWFGFPALANINTQLVKVQNVKEVLDDDAMQDLTECQKILDKNNQVFFCVKKSNLKEAFILDDVIKVGNKNNLSNFEEYYFVFADPALMDNNPGWPLRNYINLLLHHCPLIHGKQLQFIALRFIRQNKAYSSEKSLVFTLEMPDFGGDFKGNVINKPAPIWCGWERNERGNMGPRMSNMKKFVDSKSLAEQAADLNLKLMKWRLLPDINLDIIKETKFLLLGSGTLGCSVARVLLGWGARNITMVDNATVSLSNPLRQSLFTYEDAEQNKPKALAAAENLKKIFPVINASGIQMSIPMPGHTVSSNDEKETKETVDKLSELINSHDVIFLLMDSRESRWLPTLLSACYGKLVINAALGFDSYLVMRHGVRDDIKEAGECVIPDASSSSSSQAFQCMSGDELGCYFCNDITAPGNSLKDRTLDQQCTVTRPGVSVIAGALAVELAISLLQASKKGKTPAFYKLGREHNDYEPPNGCNLGIIPHSIRGFLSNFTSIMPANSRCSTCIACSDKVLSEYKTNGFDFLLKVFNSSKHLEDVLGLDFSEKTGEEVWILSEDEMSD